MKHFIPLLLLIGLSFTVSCKKDDDDPRHPATGNTDNEVITSLLITFSDTTGVLADTTFAFRDPDGNGGAPPVRFDTLQLQSGTTYRVRLVLLDETKIPADTISNEVAQESADHLFFFVASGINLTTTYLDADENGLPVGLLSRWITGAPSAGTAEVILKHQAGVKDGTFPPGETDVDVVFPCTIH